MIFINFYKFFLQRNVISNAFKIFYLLWFIVNIGAYFFNSPKATSNYCYALTLNQVFLYIASIFGVTLITKELLSMDTDKFVAFRKDFMKIDTFSHFNLLLSLFIFSLIHVFFITLPHIFIYIINMAMKINHLIIFMTVIEIMIFLAYIFFLGVFVFSCTIINFKHDSSKNNGGFTPLAVIMCIIISYCPLTSILASINPEIYYSMSNNKTLLNFCETVDYLSLTNIITIGVAKTQIDLYTILPRFIFIISSYLLLVILVILIDYFIFYNKFKNYLKLIENKIKSI